MVTLFENDVTNCVENFMDVPHTVYRALQVVPEQVAIP